MNSVEKYQSWFETFSEEWISGAYTQNDYSYPVGYHRLRILCNDLENVDIVGKKVLDIGCGGGDISLMMVKKGAIVTGIDMTDSMLKVCCQRKEQLSDDLKKNIEFRKENVLDLSKDIANTKYDYIIAFGLIGYLESDERFFEVVKGLSKTNTVLYLSSRNELFNITSISSNTIKEIDDGNAMALIDEINSYYEKKISYEKSMKFLNEIGNAVDRLKMQKLEYEMVEKSVYNSEKNLSFARQSTPQKLKLTANDYQYRLCQYWGIHPHLLLPKFNWMLPTKMFNMLSDALCVFEDEDISLIWSSVFIGKFEYKG